MLLGPAVYASIGVASWRVIHESADSALLPALGFGAGAIFVLRSLDRLHLPDTRRALWGLAGILALVFWWCLLLALTS